MTKDQGTPFAVERGVIAFHLRALGARRRVLFLVTAAALAVGVLWVAQRPPTYKATAQVLVSPLPQGDQTFFGVSLLRDAADTTRTLDTAVTLLDTPSAAARAARTMGKGWTRREVEAAVTVKTQPAANIIDVSALADSAGDSARLANAFARAALRLRGELISQQASIALKRAETQLNSIGSLNPADASDLLRRVNKLTDVAGGTDPTLTLAERATAPDHTSGIPSWLVVLAAGVGGLALGAGGILLFELLDRRVRDEEDILESYPLPVLTRIPTMPRHQRNALGGPEPALSPGVRERFRMVRPQLAPGDDARRTILVTSPSAGDGKTTAAIGLALSLLGPGQHVLLADLDLRRATLTERLLGRLAEQGVERLLHPGTSLADLVVEAPATPGLTILPAVPAHDLALVEVMLRRINELLADGARSADYVVIDAPPLADVGDALWLADWVDDMILVARPGNTFRAHLGISRDMLQRAGHLPDGLIIMGGPEGRVSPYSAGTYGYGPRTGGPLRRLVSRAADAGQRSRSG
jgi:succinoglycan biosynthesis transport protein ExoP